VSFILLFCLEYDENYNRKKNDIIQTRKDEKKIKTENKLKSNEESANVDENANIVKPEKTGENGIQGKVFDSLRNGEGGLGKKNLRKSVECT